MKDPNKELSELFSNSRLAPSDAFQKRLSKQLTAKPKRSYLRFLAPVAAVAMVAVLLLGVSLFQPSAPKRLAKRTVLLSSLYASALADELPRVDATNFWSITTNYTNGPAAEQCGLKRVDNVDYPSTTGLYYKDTSTTAYYMYGGFASDQFIGGYSEDVDVPAFDIDSLSSSESGVIRGMLVGAVLTDKDGNKLPKDATTPFKSSGIYDLYALNISTPDDKKNYVEGCERLVIHIQIDASKGSYNLIEVFNKSITPENLFHSQNQYIETKSVASFTDVLPIFQAAGFDLETAKATTAQFDYVEETNKAAGMQFYYRKSSLGRAGGTAVKNGVGEVTEYRYNFAKQPEVVYHFYTAAGVAKAEYRNVAELKAEAVAKNWTIVADEPQPGIILRDYGQVKSHYFKAHDGKFTYQMNDSGSTDLPIVFVKIPYGLGDKEISNEYDGSTFIANDLLSPAGSALYFKPGTSPPKGL